jgi:hypothetical protein
MASLLTLKFRDHAGKEGSFSAYIDAALSPGDAELTAFIQEWIDLSDAQLVSASLQEQIAIGGLTNPAAVDSGSSSLVQTQAVMQATRDDGTGYVRLSVPAPKDSIFLAAGPTQDADVDNANADVVAFAAAADPVAGTHPWVSAQGTGITYQKGWKKGYKHSESLDLHPTGGVHSPSSRSPRLSENFPSQDPPGSTKKPARRCRPSGGLLSFYGASIPLRLGMRPLSL